MIKARMFALLIGLCFAFSTSASASSWTGTTEGSGSGHPMGGKVHPYDTALYSNGGINGAMFGWAIDNPNSVADSFTLSKPAIFTTATYGSWNIPGDFTTSIYFCIGTDPLAGACAFDGAIVPTSDTYFGSNGYSLYENTFNIEFLTLGPGTYWLTLFNATTSLNQPSYWDVNNGPSAAWNSQYGYLGGGAAGNCLGFGGTCSESFSIQGISFGGNTPEPSSLMLFGSGLLGLGGVIRHSRRLR